MPGQSKIGWRSYKQLVSYILDTYTGAMAIYSLRKLKGDYSGSAIRVRRSSDNASTDIGFLANGDLNVGTLTSFVGLNDGFVTTWYDQSGNNKNATQVTAVSQPKIVSTGSIILRGGKPCVYFDGIDDTLSISNSISSPSTVTLFALAFANGLNTSNDMIMGARGALSFRYSGSGTSLNYMCITRAESTDYIYGYIPSNKNTLGVFHSSPTKTRLYSNGVWRGDATSPGALSIPISYIGSSGDGQWFQDGIQELIFYSNDQLNNRTLIENDINNYYSIWSAPTVATNGLILNLDATNNESYPGIGNSWFNLTGTQSMATLVNGPIFATANDGSIRFDGVNDYSSIPVNLSSYSQITIEVWYKVNNNSSGIIFEHSSNWNNNSGALGLAVNASGCVYDATYMHTNHKDGSDARNYLFTSGASWSCHVNVFSRVADPTGRLAYVNGQLVPFVSTNSCGGGGWSTSTATGNWTAFRNDSMFLMSRSGQSFLNGNIGAIRIYGRKLTANEILQNYNVTKSKFGL